MNNKRNSPSKFDLKGLNLRGIDLNVSIKLLYMPQNPKESQFLRGLKSQL